MAEKQIQDDIIEFLNKAGYAILRVNGTSRGKIKSYYLKTGIEKSIHKGFPDVLAMRGKIAYLFEVKTETGVVSAEQVKVKEVLGFYHVDVYVVSSVNEVNEILKKERAN